MKSFTSEEVPICCMSRVVPGANIFISLSDSQSKLNVLWLVVDPTRMESAKVSVPKNACYICLARLLEGKEFLGLASVVCLEVLGNLSDKTLEGEFWDE